MTRGAIAKVSPPGRLEASHKRCLHVLRQAGDALQYAGPTTAPFDGERSCIWLAQYEFGYPKHYFGRALDQRRRSANLYGWPKLPDSYQDNLAVSPCGRSRGSLSGLF